MTAKEQRLMRRIRKHGFTLKLRRRNRKWCAVLSNGDITVETESTKIEGALLGAIGVMAGEIGSDVEWGA